MSGGYFDYLHRTDVEGLSSRQGRENLQKLIGFLRVHEYDAAAEEFEQFYRAVQHSIKSISWSEVHGGAESNQAAPGLGAWWSQLKWLAKSAEWWASGDYGEEKFRRHWETYLEDMQSLEGGSE